MNPQLILYAFAILLVLAAVQDVLTLRISNLFPLAVIGLFAGWLTVQGVPDNIWENAVHFVIALGGGMVLFGFGWMGGGDAKLYAASALWFGLTAAITLLFYVSVSGAILLIIMIIIRRLVAIIRPNISSETSEASSPEKTGWRSASLPYGVAIAVGTMATIYASDTNPAAKDSLAWMDEMVPTKQ